MKPIATLHVFSIHAYGYAQVFDHRTEPTAYMNEGHLTICPGNVPRFTNINSGSQDTIYITFDILPHQRDSLNDAVHGHDTGLAYPKMHTVVGDTRSKHDLFQLKGVDVNIGGASPVKLAHVLLSEVFECVYFKIPECVNA